MNYKSSKPNEEKTIQLTCCSLKSSKKRAKTKKRIANSLKEAKNLAALRVTGAVDHPLNLESKRNRREKKTQSWSNILLTTICNWRSKIGVSANKFSLHRL